MPRSELADLLSRLHDADDPAAAETAIWDRFGRVRTIFVSDMSGFSRITRKHGIVHFLALIHRMRSLGAPVVEAHGGRLVKSVADNLFATFDDPEAALRAAHALHTELAEWSAGRHEDERVQVAVGVGHGRILDLDGEDCFGDQVNLAFKLGEDIAEGGETLLTGAVRNHLGQHPWTLEQRARRIAGLDLPYWAVR